MKVKLLMAVASCCLLQTALSDRWFNSVPVLPAVVAASPSIEDPQCSHHSRMFLQALDNFTLWAVQMLDASAKVPEGIVFGSVHQLGHFDQCVDVAVQDLQGQYCLVELAFQPVSYIPAQLVNPYSLQFDPNVHVWEKLKKSVDRSKIDRSTIYLGLCTPASCKPEQLQVTLNHELRLLGENFGMQFKSKVSPQLCTTKKEATQWSAGEVVFSCAAGLLVLLVVFSSWYDRVSRDSPPRSGIGRALLCFAVQRSARSVVDAPSHNPGLECLDVYKFIFSVIIIGVHRAIIFNTVPTLDANKLEQLPRGFEKSVLIKLPLVVDFFFMASGMLSTYHVATYLQEHRSTNFIETVVKRFMRLVILKQTFLFSMSVHFGCR
ncbi:uncharacterized protein LOC134533469 [Bacillus rossius redtenbacheri]|uniref:uncharacterized protein LOC134533469 n=1 Tax=Bacillus rossius redtenbacheri TaxID=93214 RepID=UPI002FDDA1CC